MAIAQVDLALMEFDQFLQHQVSQGGGLGVGKNGRGPTFCYPQCRCFTGGRSHHSFNPAYVFVAAGSSFLKEACLLAAEVLGRAAH